MIRMKRMRRGKLGASATEVAVVIIIIGVLLSLLMPIIGKAREQALKTECISNLQAIGSAVGIYLHSSRGWFPATGDGTYWFEKVYQYMQTRDATAREWEKAKRAFQCPKAKSSQRAFGPGKISYGWNEAFVPYRTVDKSIKSASELILIADSLPGKNSHILFPTGPIRKDRVRMEFRHLGLANVLYADLHAGSLSPQQAFDQFPRYWDLE